MGRSILSAVVGWVASAVVVMLGVFVLWQIVGPQGAFEGNTIVASTKWCLMNCAWGLVAAVVAGIVTQTIDRSDNQLGVKILIGIMLPLGIVMAVLRFFVESEELPADKTVADLTFFEAGNIVVPPHWYNFSMPVIGVVAAWFAAGWVWRRRRKSSGYDAAAGGDRAASGSETS